MLNRIRVRYVSTCKNVHECNISMYVYTPLSQQPCDHSGIRQPVVHLSELALIAPPIYIALTAALRSQWHQAASCPPL